MGVGIGYLFPRLPIRVDFVQLLFHRLEFHLEFVSLLQAMVGFLLSLSESLLSLFIFLDQGFPLLLKIFQSEGELFVDLSA